MQKSATGPMAACGQAQCVAADTLLQLTLLPVTAVGRFACAPQRAGGTGRDWAAQGERAAYPSIPLENHGVVCASVIALPVRQSSGVLWSTPAGPPSPHRTTSTSRSGHLQKHRHYPLPRTFWRLEWRLERRGSPPWALAARPVPQPVLLSLHCCWCCRRSRPRQRAAFSTSPRAAGQQDGAEGSLAIVLVSETGDGGGMAAAAALLEK